MANIFHCHNFNRFILSIVLSTFSLTYAISLPAIEFQPGLNQVAFMIRLERLVEKLLKTEKKGTDAMLKALIDIKSEIESSYKVNLDLDVYFSQASKKIANAGYKVPKKELDLIKKKLKKFDKKSKHHAHYLAMTMYLEGYQLNKIDEDMLYLAKHGKDKEEEEDEENEEIQIPAQLVFGVTLTLCGLFLVAMPVPACKEWGNRMIISGIATCGNCITGKMDEKEKEKNKK